MYECIEPDCGQGMFVGTPTGRCERCQQRYTTQLRLRYEQQWEATHPEKVKKPRRVRRVTVTAPRKA